MINTIALGEHIRFMRKSKNLTQEQLVERIGDDKMSLSTIKRLESGNGSFDLVKLSRICEALECDLNDLLMDEDVVAALKNLYPQEEWEGIPYAAEIQRLFYPKPSEYPSLGGRQILSVLQLIIYLPLMDERLLYDCLYRIEGNAFDNENYVLDKLSLLYRRIPDSRAKRYADLMAKKCTYDYFMRFISSEITAEEAELLDNRKGDEWEKCYDEYMDILAEKHFQEKINRKALWQRTMKNLEIATSDGAACSVPTSE